ncbi:hypothetical protein D3C78_1692390 [compost metagenome]
MNFFFILDKRCPVLPFGVCGPFAKKREAKKAASKLRSRFPGRGLGVYGIWLAKPSQPDSLAEARAKARGQLKAMLQDGGEQ